MENDGAVPGVRVVSGALKPSEIKSTTVRGGIWKYRRLKLRIQTSSATKALLHTEMDTGVRVESFCITASAAAAASLSATSSAKAAPGIPHAARLATHTEIHSMTIAKTPDLVPGNQSSLNAIFNLSSGGLATVRSEYKYGKLPPSPLFAVTDTPETLPGMSNQVPNTPFCRQNDAFCRQNNAFCQKNDAVGLS
jgi:hypothetical protein